MFESYLNELKEKNNVRSTLAAIRDLLKIPGNSDAIKKEPGYNRELIGSFLDDDDPKIRKNAAAVMGLLREEGYADRLFGHYLSEETMFVRSAYLEALCSYDYSGYRDRLSERRKVLEDGDFDDESLKHVAAELKLLCKMTDQGNLIHAKHIFKDPEKPVDVIFTSPKEVRPYLQKEIEERNGNAGAVFCGVKTRTTDIKSLSGIRFYKEVLFPLNGMKSVPKADIPKTVCGGSLMRLLEMLHKDCRYPFYFRVTSKDIDAADMASRIQVLSGQKLINSVSDYEAEIRLIKGKDGRYGIFVKLFTLKDERFAYRKNTIATSMSAPAAAFAVYVTKGFMKQKAQVIDPFCGVGTLLIEREKAVRTGYAYGTDTFGEAVIKARENTERAGYNINYINRNYFDFKSSYKFDEMITEMPETDMDESDSFYKRFFHKSSELINNGGVMIVLSTETGLIRKYIRLFKYELVAEFPAYGRAGERIYVIRKP